MNAFDNANLRDRLNQTFTGGFAPNMTFAFNVGANTFTVNDASVYDTGDFRKSAIVILTDKNGKQVTGQMAADNLAGSLADAVVLSTATLDKSGGLYAQVCLVTNKRMSADGHANHTAIAALNGSFGSWQLNTHPIDYVS